MNNTDKYLSQLESILEKAKKVSEAAEVFLVSSEETPVHLEANRVKSIRSRQSQVVSLRIFKNGRVGYATANNLLDPDSLVRSAEETSMFGAEATFQLPAPGKHLHPTISDTAVPDVTMESMMAQAINMVETLVTHTPGLLCEGGVGKETASVALLNTSGFSESYTRTEYSAAVEGVLTRGTDMLFVGDEISSCRVITDVSSVTDSIMLQLDRAAATAGVSSGKLPVVFTPHGVASALVAPLMAGFNGKLVYEKASPLAGKSGRKLMDAKFSLYDDATLPMRPTSRPFDDEGVPSRRCPLVEGGVVKYFYYDLRTAALASTQSTGHGHRTAGQPVPSPSAFVFSTGTDSIDDMVSSIGDGLMVEQLMGATQGNILGGDFSGNVLLGYRIENGRITGRVKDTVVFGNVYSLLKEITALGSDARWAGGIYSPSILFPSLSVASKG